MHCARIEVGEIQSSVVAAVAVAATTTVGNITSLVLQPGVWRLDAFAVINGGATGLTSGSTVNLSIVSASATNGVAGATMSQESVLALLAGGLFSLSLLVVAVNLPVATTYYLTAKVDYIAGSPTVSATMRALRIR